MDLPVFDDNRIDHNCLWKYDEITLEFLLSKYFLSKKTVTLISYLNSIYTNNEINVDNLNKFIEQKSYLFDLIKDTNLEFLDKFKTELNFYDNKNESELLDYLRSRMKSSLGSPLEIMPILYAYERKHDIRPEYYYLAGYFYVYFRFVELCQKITDTFESIDVIYDKFLIKDLICFNYETNFLDLCNVKTIKDLKTVSSHFILALFPFKINELLSLLEQYNFHWDLAEKTINIILGYFNDNQYDVLSYRYGLHGKYYSVEETANMLDVPLERINELEQEIKSEICEDSYSKRLKDKLNELFRTYFIKIKSNYVCLDDFKRSCNSYSCARKICCFLKIFNSKIKFSETFDLIYDSSSYSPKDFCDCFIKNKGTFINRNQLNCSNSSEQKIIENCYLTVNSELLVRKNIKKIYLIEKVVEENFENGYKIDDKQTFDKLTSILKNKYGNLFDSPSIRNFDCKIYLNPNFCLIDKGLYQHINKCVTLPKTLVDEIANYLREQKGAITYLTLFENFKDKLNNHGVSNYYYMKGLLDRNLSSEFHTTRTYIQCVNSDKSFQESLLDYCKSFDGFFTLSDLINKFPGVKEYTFTNALTNEIENGLINLSGKRYIYLKNLNIDRCTIDSIKNIIENLYKEQSENYLTDRQIFNSLINFYPDIISNLKVCDSSFSLFGIVHALFPFDFIFIRHNIYKK